MSCHFFLSSFSRQPTSRKGQLCWTNGGHVISLLSHGGNFCTSLLESCLTSLPWHVNVSSSPCFFTAKAEKALQCTTLLSVSIFLSLERRATDAHTLWQKGVEDPFFLLLNPRFHSSSSKSISLHYPCVYPTVRVRVRKPSGRGNRLSKATIRPRYSKNDNAYQASTLLTRSQLQL